MNNCSPDPIILIGAARSGTKFLRDLLASAHGVKAVPYDVNYVWRYGVVSHPDDKLDPNDLSAKKIAFIRSTLPKLAKAGCDDILIEKSVSNTLRIPYVAKVFPRARYVHLIRDGRDVTESAMRLWQAPPDWKALLTKLRGMPLSNIGYVSWFAKNFLTGIKSGRKGGGVWGPRFPGIHNLIDNAPLAEICAQQWKHSVLTATQDLNQIAPERVFNIRYEDLIKDDTALRSLINDLNLPDEESIISDWTAKLRPSKPALWRELPESDMQIIVQTLAALLAAMEYQ